MPKREENAGATGVTPAELMALHQVQSRLALSTDAGNWKEFLDCFVPAAEVDYGTLGVGPIEKIVGLIQEYRVESGFIR